ncbi:MAG: cupredoxin domain-containing protein [Sciscionella sp.]
MPPTVSPGEKITVHNSDDVAHTVTADTAKSLFDVNIPPSGNATLTAPDKPGSYKFHCNYHANMHGTLTVR